MPPKPANKPERRKALNQQEVRILVKAVGTFMNVAERFGVAFTIILILFFFVWMMGTAQTKDDFLRELLFGSISKTHYLAFFMIALAIIAIFGLDTKVRSYRTEQAEMKRVSNEKTEWQQRALRTDLSHTEGPEGES